MESVVRFQTLHTGQRIFRYLQVRESALWTDGDSKNTTILFLGQNVLDGTTVSLKNMSRSHFTFSKNRHCLKLTLPARLNKLSTSSWFYDMKGLMHVAFNLYSYREQVALMSCLFTLWSKIGDRSLPSDVIVSTDDIVINKNFDFMVLMDQPHESCQMCEAEKSSTEANTQTETVSKQDIYTMARPTVGNKKTQTLQLEEDLLCSGKRKKLMFDFNGPVTRNFFDLLEQVMKEFLNESIHDIFFYKVYNLFEVFIFLVRGELQLIETTTTGIFPFHLMVEYSKMKKSYYERERDIQPDIFYQDNLLKMFSKWLGLQFHNFRHAITSQIEGFKKTLIRENQFLPTPTRLLNDHSLFPMCMTDFLNQWLDDEQERKEDTDFQNSKILLVLELMNDNLITGVGHVVYAKLKSMDTM